MASSQRFTGKRIRYTDRPAEACYLGWQESLDQFAKLVEPDIQD